MREICTSGSVGGEGGNILAYPALRPPYAAVPTIGLSTKQTFLVGTRSPLRSTRLAHPMDFAVVAAAGADRNGVALLATRAPGGAGRSEEG
jgi:hypothetical protein